MSSLAIKSVDKSYGDIQAIKNVSIDVADGEFLVLVGPSGCGKSTLLRMIAGLEGLSNGKIFLGDRDVSHVDPKDRDVAMVFQNYALYPHMTVFENMAFSLQQRKFDKEEIKEIIQDTARILDLTELLERKPGALSGGQRQRVAMGRAIVRNPAIYLMDEPLSNLDAKLRVQMRAELKLLRERLGVTTVYVTHDQVEAMTLGDRVAVLAPVDKSSPSNLQQIDTPHALYYEPKNLFVAGFIGSPAMNFFYVDLEELNGVLVATIMNTDIRLRLPYEINAAIQMNADKRALASYAGSQVIMGVRPEFFKLVNDDESAFSFQVDILVSEVVGADAYLHFDLDTPDVSLSQQSDDNDTGPDKQQSVAKFTARIESELFYQTSGKVRLSIDATKVHFFDTATTERIP